MRCQNDLPATPVQSTRTSVVAHAHTAPGWYVVYTEARQESLAAANLQDQGFEAYLPLYKTLKRKTGARVDGASASRLAVVYEPMFPRYMFFRPSHQAQSISPARSTRGVSCLVRFGAQLALVPETTLQAIRAHEQRRNESDLNAISPLQPGRRVRLDDPLLTGLQGLVHSVSAHRVIVLMEILGHQTPVTLRQDQAVPI